MVNHKEDIQKELLSTYKSLLESRDDMIKLISHPFFTDEETPERTLPGLLISLEGILALVYPIYGKIYSIEDFWNKKIDLFKKMLKVIIEEFRFVVHELNSGGEGFFFDGKPYYEPKLSNTLSGKNEHFTESVALSISGAIYLRYFFKLIESSKISEDINNTINLIFEDLTKKFNSTQKDFDFYRQDDSIDSLKRIYEVCEDIIFSGLEILIQGRAKDEIGWGWSTGVKQTDLYFTYQVIETLSDIGDVIQGEDLKKFKVPKDKDFFKNDKKKKKEFDKLWNNVKQIRKVIKNFLLDNFINELGQPLTEEKLKNKVFDQIHHEYTRIYYNLYIFDILILLKADGDEKIKKRMLERYDDLKELYIKLENAPDPEKKSVEKLYQDNPDISTFKNNLELDEYSDYSDEIIRDPKKYYVEDPGYYQLFLRVDSLINCYVEESLNKLKFSEDLYKRIIDVRTKGDFIWENVWDEGGYLISLSQRSLESIVDYFDLLVKGYDPDYDKLKITGDKRNINQYKSINEDIFRKIDNYINDKLSKNFEKYLDGSNYIKKIKNDLYKEIKNNVYLVVEKIIEDKEIFNGIIMEIFDSNDFINQYLPSNIIISLINLIITGADIEKEESIWMIERIVNYIDNHKKGDSSKLFHDLNKYLKMYFEKNNKGDLLPLEMNKEVILKQFIKAFSENSIS